MSVSGCLNVVISEAGLRGGFGGAASGFPTAMIASSSSGCRTERADSSSGFAISGPVIQQVPYPIAKAARMNWVIPAEIP